VKTDFTSSNTQECVATKYWVAAIVLAPIFPFLLFAGYLSINQSVLIPLFRFPFPLIFMFYLVFGPTYIYAYSRVVKENVFLSASGGFLIPIIVFLLFLGELDEFVIWCGVFGGLCGICFDFILHGFRFKCKLEFNRESRDDR